MVESQMLYFFSVLKPPREIRQANLWKYRAFASHQRCLIPASFNFYQQETFLPHPLECGFLTPLVCGCELWRCLDVHIMLCPSLAAGSSRSNKASEQSRYVAAIAAWHASEKCQQTGADKVGVNSWLTQSPFWNFTFVFSLFPSLLYPFFSVCQCIPQSIFSLLYNCLSCKPIIPYNRQSFYRICHSWWFNIQRLLSATGSSPSCALRLRDTGLIFTQAMPPGRMMQPVQN